MAQIATVTEVATVDSDTQPRVAGIPVGTLRDVDLVTAVVGYSVIVANRFPVPPTAAAFLTEIEALEDTPMVFDVVFGPPIAAALSPESVYLEPTIGQIWPR